MLGGREIGWTLGAVSAVSFMTLAYSDTDKEPMKIVVESPRHRKRVPLLAAMAAISLVVAVMVVVLVASVQGAAALREEGEEAILLTKMAVELETIAAHNDALMAIVIESPESSRAESGDHADLESVASIAGFSTAAAELRPMLDETNKVTFDEMTRVYDRYVESVDDLHSLESVGGDLITQYYQGTQQLEAEIRNVLSTMRLHESEEIQAAVSASLRRETLMLWLVPTLFVLALAIAAIAFRSQSDLAKHTIRTLRRSNDEKEAFLATMSHELRTPLTSVLGFVDILESDGESLPAEERRAMLNLVSREALEMSNLIEDILVMTRAGAGALFIADVRVDLNSQVAQVLEVMEEEPRVLNASGGQVAAQGDPSRVRQIIRNLLTNAFRYGGDHVQIHIDSDDHQTRLQVIDDGAGVPDDKQQEIFEPYNRVDPGSSPTGSVGLGLAVSRQLARAMGGDLTYRYKTGHSIFEFRLQPAAPPPTTPDPVLASTAL